MSGSNGIGGLFGIMGALTLSAPLRPQRAGGYSQAEMDAQIAEANKRIRTVKRTLDTAKKEAVAKERRLLDEVLDRDETIDVLTVENGRLREEVARLSAERSPPAPRSIPRPRSSGRSFTP